jgi:hypothetical protein
MSVLIWQDSYLNRLASDGEQDIVNRVPCLFHRFPLDIISGQSVYTLPVKTSRIRRITWLGIKLDPITFDDLCKMNPNFVWASSTNKIDIPLGRPLYYTLHPTNLNDIRFYPCPDTSITYDSTNVYGAGTNTNVIISCFRNIDGTDSTAQLPDYIYRRAIKAYVLWKAYNAEGKGQNLKTSEYYRNKYEYYVNHFIKLNSDAFVTKKYSLYNSYRLSTKPARPVLPPNY